MRRIALISWVLLAFFSYSLLANDGQASEQRVLLSFDNSGHHVRKIFYSDAQSIQPEPTLVRAVEVNFVQAAIAGLESGQATVLWQDHQGDWYPSSQAPDPRVSHAPGHITGAENTQVSDVSGAWLVSGPGKATRIIVLLPSNMTLGLGFEQWEVSLL